MHKHRISSTVSGPLRLGRALRLGRGRRWRGSYAMAFERAPGWSLIVHGLRMGDEVEGAVVRKGEEERGRRGREMKGLFAEGDWKEMYAVLTNTRHIVY